MKYHAILFDLDGTLLDTAPDFITATHRLAEEMQLECSDDAVIRNAVTHGSKGILEKVFAVSETNPEFAATKQRFLDIYMDCLAEQTRPFPGITELLMMIGDHNVPWGIVTNKPVLYTKALLKQLPLQPAPATIICPDHVKNTKPDPEPIELACAQLALEPSQTLYIGDHLRDIQAGQRAGAATIAAAYGYLDAAENPDQWGADHIVYHASEITELLT